MAHRTGAIESKDLERVVVDTTVQEKAIAHPTRCAGSPTGRSIEARRDGQTRGRRACARVITARGHNARPLRLGARHRSCPTSLKRALAGATQIPAHATWPHPSATFPPQDRGRCCTGRICFVSAARILHCGFAHQEQRQRGPKVYSWHAPEVECIGRGKATDAEPEFALPRCRLPREPPRPKADSSLAACQGAAWQSPVRRPHAGCLLSLI